MGFKTDVRDCAGIEVTTVQLGAMRAAKLIPKLGRLLIPVLAMEGIDADSDASALIPALMSLFTALDAEDMEALSLSLLVSSRGCSHREDGTKFAMDLDSLANINTVFGANLDALLLALRAAIEVNYLSFIERAKAAAGARSQKAEDKSDSPKT